MTSQRRVPVFNRSDDVLDVCIEPEGDVIPLNPGGRLDVVYQSDGDADPGLEIEVSKGMLVLHCMATKQIWQENRRIR